MKRKALLEVVKSNKVQFWMNLLMGVLFMAMIPVSLVTGLQHSVPFLVGISLWALVAAHWGAALAAHAANAVVDSEGKQGGDSAT